MPVENAREHLEAAIAAGDENGVDPDRLRAALGYLTEADQRGRNGAVQQARTALEESLVADSTQQAQAAQQAIDALTAATDTDGMAVSGGGDVDVVPSMSTVSSSEPESPDSPAVPNDDSDGDPDEAGNDDPDQGTPDDQDDSDGRDLTFRPGETVSVEVELPSAVWARIRHAIEDTSDDSVESWVQRQVRVALDRVMRKHEDRRTPDVEIDDDTWRRIQLKAAQMIQAGKDPERALDDAEIEYLQVHPQLVVDGQPVGVEDLPAAADDLDDGDHNTDGDAETDGGERVVDLSEVHGNAPVEDDSP